MLKVLNEQQLDSGTGTLLATAQHAVWTYHQHTGLRMVAGDFGSILGFKHSSSDASFQDWLHEDDREAFAQLLQAACEPGATPVTEHRLVSPIDGEVRWLLSRAAGEFDAGGQALRVHGVSQDVTRLKQVEQQLREAIARFESLTQASPGLIFSSDAQGGATFFNDVRWVEFTGLEAGSWAGEGWLQAIHPEDRARSKQLWLDGVAREEIIVVEDRFLHADGSLRYILFHAHPVYDENGFAGHVGTGTDISELKAAQQQQEEMRTAMLESRKLEAIGTLASGVAHDFNNQLMAISGYIELALLELPKNSRVTELVQQASEAARQARSVTDGLLTFARREEVETKPVDVAELTRRNTQFIRKLLPGSIQFELEACETPLWVHGNEGRLVQLVLNMIVNSSDAMPDGGQLCVRVAEVNHDGAGSALLQVSDTGTGMDEATRQRIFEPFFTTKATGQGTGLGMSLVHGVVVSHGGTIDVESTPGKGTTITVQLPVCQPPASVSETETPPAELITSGRILLVEDNPLVRESCARRLEVCGFEVIQAADGMEALTHCGQRDINLVVMDVDLPGKDGVRVADELRRQLGSLPVVFITGNPSNAALKRAQAGDPVLTKPVEFDALTRKMGELIRPAAQVNGGRH